MADAKREVLYFEEGGAQHTDATLECALSALGDRGLTYLVVASGGDTVVKAVDMLERTRMSGAQVVGVTLQQGTWPKYGEPNWDKLATARKKGAKILTCTHALMGTVESAIREQFGGMPPVELIAHTLYTFSQGTKVVVEITMSAVDAGLVPPGHDVVAVAGSGGGADTACVVKAESTVNFFDLRVKELLCKPL